MHFTTLIDVEDLARNLRDPEIVIVDCSFSLADSNRGRFAYERAHIPGAVYAHLDQDLSAEFIPGSTGRHPLPAPEVLARTLGSWGIDSTVQLVAYDDSAGNIAARLWWMMRWLGHDAAAVLDGGWAAWVGTGGRAEVGIETRESRRFIPHPKPEMQVNAERVEQIRLRNDYRLVDSRSADRYRGQNETIDPVAGHIPGALSLPYQDNLRSDGRFLAPGDLRKRFEHLLSGVPPDRSIFYCGSGVTAAHNLLAMAYAGVGEGILYPGSWSEWITDPSRPIETGSGGTGGKASE